MRIFFRFCFQLAHDQGAVMSCLAKKQDDLSKNCQKHIQRLAELQSDDYHLDRALYYACREDRERFCSQVAAGNGRIYRCLYAQKFNSLLSPVVSTEFIFEESFCNYRNVLVSRRNSSTTENGSFKC